MRLDVYFHDQIRRLEKVDNIGLTDDGRDLYAVIERWSRAVDQQNPLRCAGGCSECCQSETVPRASVADWAYLHAHLVGLPQDRQAALLKRNRELYLSLAAALLQQVRTGDGPPSEVSLPSQNPCPLLEGGRCGVYAARPLICRLFGYFVHGPSRQVMSCTPGVAHLHALVEQQRPVILPDVMPIFETWSRLTSYLDAPLPLWLMAHDLGEGLDPICRTAPDFDGTVRRLQNH